MNSEIDSLGRIVVPMKMRRTLGLVDDTRVTIERQGDKIIIKKRLDDNGIPPIDILRTMTKEELIGLLLNRD